MSLFRKVEYLKKVGNREVVAKYKNQEEKLINSFENYAAHGGFSQWKKKVSTIERTF